MNPLDEAKIAIKRVQSRTCSKPMVNGQCSMVNVQWSMANAQFAASNSSKKRTSFSEKRRRSLTWYLRLVIRSMPMPKA